MRCFRALVLCSSAACTVNFDPPSGLACDQEHPCQNERICYRERCVDKVPETPLTFDAGTVDAAVQDAGLVIDAGPEIDAGADAGSGSPDSGSDSGIGALDAGPINLHPAGTFDNGNCAPWVSYRGQLSGSLMARSGAGSCRVCSSSQANDFFSADDSRAVGPVAVGTTFRARAWVRTDAANPPSSVSLALRTQLATGVPIETSESAPRPIDGGWQLFESTLAVMQPDGGLNVVLFGAHQPGACFLLDDVVVEQLK
jgi:hypothetical protein